MSSPGSPTDRQRRRSSLRLTASGWAVLAAALALAAAGAARSELAALIWGCSFLLLILYALAGTLSRSRRLARHLARVPDPLDLKLPAQGIFPGMEAEAQVRADIPRGALPGFSVLFSARLRFQDREPVWLQAPLSAGRSRQATPFAPRLRGRYRCTEVELRVRDRLGFAETSLRIPLEEFLCVYPNQREPREDLPRPRPGGEERRRLQTRRRSEELWEVRKYYPGDDPRRIHWKLFAHSGEMLLRIGEKSPPPESRYLVILDTGAAPEALEALIEACAACALTLAARGMQVLFVAGDGEPPLEVCADKREKLLARLAGQWRSEEYRFQFPARKGLEALLFSTAESPHRRRLLEVSASRGWTARQFLHDEAPPEQVRAPMGFKERLRAALFAGNRDAVRG